MTPLPPKPIPFTPQRGLILNQPLAQVGKDAAIDLCDVDWREGALHSREGAKVFSAEDGAANYEALFPHSDFRLLSRRGTKLVAFKNSDGKELAETITVSSLHLAFARIGTPAASYTYIADAEGTIKRFDGALFTSPTATVDGVAGKAMPLGKFLVTWADEGNRLVVLGTVPAGGPNGAISSGSHVWFSVPGNAEEFESTAFVQLDPGDGEDITGGCVWGGQIFVFKESRMFVFYGISPDSEGKPIFNFRTVDLGTRLVKPPENGGELCCVGSEGVYFVSSDGLWVTTGGEPALLSGDLEPLAYTQALVGPAASIFDDLRWDDVRGVCFTNSTIYVGLGTAHIELLLKLDLRALRWTVWKTALNGMAYWNEETADAHKRLYFSASANAHKRVFFYTPVEDIDPTVEMEPRWRSGFYELENADEKTVVHAKLWGTGKVTLKVAEDYKALDAGTEFELGEAPAIAQMQRQVGQTATLFSHEFSGDAPWSVQRLDRYVQSTRVPETQKP